MFSQRSSVPMVEQLEGRRLFSAGIESVHGFIAPDGSPYLYGKYTLNIQTNPADPHPSSESHLVTIKRHDGPAFGGWVWGGKRTLLKGSWDKTLNMWRFSLEFTTSTGRITHKGQMAAVWDATTQRYEGIWGYVNHGHHFDGGMVLTKIPA